MTVITDTNFDEQIAFYRLNGWLITELFDEGFAASIKSWVDDVQSWDDSGQWLNHYEETEHGAQKCRTEYFTPFHQSLRALLCDGPMLDIAGKLLGEPAVLYKEKINYKLAGGAGWDAHQDAPAYPFLDQHISCMVAVDDANQENGCLEVVSRHHHALIPTDSRGCIPDSVVATLDWQPVPLRVVKLCGFTREHRIAVATTNRRATVGLCIRHITPRAKAICANSITPRSATSLRNIKKTATQLMVVYKFH